MSTLQSRATEGDVVVLHGCAHNPTGLDFTKDQWKAIAGVCEQNGLIPFFDLAYQDCCENTTTKQSWQDDLHHMSDRMKSMRRKLVDGLEKRQTPGCWDHIFTDIGVFSMTVLQPEQIRALSEEYHVYLLPLGRVSTTGLTNHNVEHVAEAFHQFILAAKSEDLLILMLRQIRVDAIEDS